MPQQLEARRVPFAEPLGRQLRSTGSARGTVLSAFVHAGIIAILLYGAGKQHFFDSRAPGDDTGGRGGGGGGGGVRAVAVFAALAGRPAPPPVAPPVQQQLTVPLETPTVIPEVVEKPPEEAPVTPIVPAPSGAGDGSGAGTGVGPGSGTGTGGGIGGGVGSGIGNDSGPGGGGGTVIPPQLQGILIPPPDKPRELRGTIVRVIFRISERGEVLDVSTEPAIRDRGYRNKFIEQMRRYTFTPAYTRVGHQPVAWPVEISVRF